MDLNSASILTAYVLDLVFGDPQGFPHPVRIIGWFIKRMEPQMRKFFSNERIAGSVFGAFIIGGSYAVTFLVLLGLNRIHPYAGLAGSIFLIYTTLSVKDLKLESTRVFQALRRNDLLDARKNLALIVGRDTENLNEQEIIRATVETIAENIVDGIISPLFYTFLGGAPLAMAYKAINTLDSMVGYKNERYNKFGWASAKIDDLANFIPARITGLLVPLATWLNGKDGVQAWKTMWQDGHKNPSLNSGIPEAAVAGALGIRLGGLNYYGGHPSLKPYLGKDQKPLALDDITDTIKIMYTCSVLAVVVGLSLTFLA